jgi:hypothetical protein
MSACRSHCGQKWTWRLCANTDLVSASSLKRAAKNLPLGGMHISMIAHRDAARGPICSDSPHPVLRCRLGEPMRAIPILLFLLLLAGCVTAQQQQSPWLRADGRTGSARQLEADRTICMGERQNTREADQAVRTCMAQRGWLPEDQP